MAASSSLNVVRVTLHPVRLALHTPFKIATMTAWDAPNVFVKVEAEGGLIGWGEASFMQSINGETAETVAASLQALSRMAIGQPVTAVRWIWDEMTRALPGQTAARCALDTALWDAASQAAGLSLVQRLGGKARVMETDMTIGALSPDEARKAARDLAAQGFRVIKLKIGTGLEADRARWEAVKEGAGPGVKIRLDANQGYSRLEAHQAFGTDSFAGAEYVEQPLEKHDLEGMAWLSGFSRVPVMADESVFSAKDAARFASSCPLVNVKISKAGGITGALAVAEVAEAHGQLAMMGGMMESRLGVTASAHAAASRRVFQRFDLDAHKDHKVDPILGGVTHSEGCVHLPEGPGLGARVDEAFLKEFPAIVVE